MAVSINGNGTVTGLTDLTSGDLTVDTNTLHVDSTNNRVGVGTTTPTTALDVSGTVNATAFTGDGSALTGVGNETITLSGDVTGSGTTAITTTVANDSHSHTTSTLSGNISAFTNDAGYITSGGKVLQVVQTVKTDVYTSTTANSWGDVTGLSCTITPSSTSSKILCLVHVNGGGTPGQVAARMRFLRGGTVIYQGDASGTRTRGIGQNSGGDTAFNGTAIAMYLDSPATTSATTYKIQRHAENTNLFCINRTIRDADGNDCRSASSITLMEIAG